MSIGPPVKHVTKIWFGVCLAGLALGWVMGSLAATPGVAGGARRHSAVGGRRLGLATGQQSIALVDPWPVQSVRPATVMNFVEVQNFSAASKR
jgi:hypothetical protein